MALALRLGGSFGLGDWLALSLGFMGVVVALVCR